MGLFRRGTKLLRLGSGLRDCCCRPENPEECWCPSYCSYYFEFKGYSNETDGVYIGEQVCFPRYRFIEADNCRSLLPSEGVCTTLNGVTASPSQKLSWYTFGHNESAQINPGLLIPVGAMGVGAFEVDAGIVSGEVVDGFLTLNYVSRGLNRGANLGVFCELNTAGVPCWKFHASLNFFATDFYSEFDSSTSEGLRKIVSSDFQASITREFYCREPGASCEYDPNRECTEQRDFGIDVFHLPDTVFTLTPEGVTVSIDGNEQVFSWDESQTVNGCEQERYLGSYPFGLYETTACADTVGEFDSDFVQYEVAVKKKESCQEAGPCNCNADLFGMQVQLSDYTFTYGDLETYSAQNSYSVWRETLPGLFTRTRYDTCDNFPSDIKVSEETANVFCTVVEGVDYWGVVLTLECYERDDCVEEWLRSRVTQWTGLFECGPDGKPQGFPHSPSDPNEPPELLYDLISDPPPTGEFCTADRVIPSFRFI